MRKQQEETPKPEKKASAKEEADLPLAQANEVVTEAGLRKHWQQYTEKVRQEGRQIEYTILKEEPRFNAQELLITVSLHNPIQEDRFQELRPQLQHFLRRQLKNSQLQLTGQFEDAPTRKRLYTNHEKFDYLLQKYPQLQEMRNRLGLEPD